MPTFSPEDKRPVLDRDEWIERLIPLIDGANKEMALAHRASYKMQEFIHNNRIEEDFRSSNLFSSEVSQLVQQTATLSVRWAEFIRMLELLGLIEDE